MTSIFDRETTFCDRATLVLVALVTMLALTFASAPRAAAQEWSPADPPSVTDLTSFEAIDRHLDDDGALHMLGALQDSAIDDQLLTEFAGGFLAAGGTVVGAEHLGAEIKYGIPNSAVPLNCKGKSGYQMIPHTIVWLDSCQAQVLSGYLGVGASAAAIAGVITGFTGVGATVGALIGGVLWGYSSLVPICGAYGNGIGIIVHSFFPPGIFCGSQ